MRSGVHVWRDERAWRQKMVCARYVTPLIGSLVIGMIMSISSRPPMRHGNNSNFSLNLEDAYQKDSPLRGEGEEKFSFEQTRGRVPRENGTELEWKCIAASSQNRLWHFPHTELQFSKFFNDIFAPYISHKKITYWKLVSHQGLMWRLLESF